MAWNRPSAANQQPAKKDGGTKRSLLHGIIAGIAVVVLGGVVLFIFSGGDTTPSVEVKKKPGTIKEVKPKAAPTAKAEVSTATNNAPSAQQLLWMGQKVVRYSATTNAAAGKIIETLVTDDGKIHKRLIEEKRSIFDNSSDELISMAITTPPGQIMPPLPMYPGFEKDFKEALNNPIKINEDDPPKVKELKERVIAAREDIKAMMDQGMTIREILTEHEKVWNENAEIRRDAQKGYDEVLANGSEEDARKYRIKMDAALQQMGIHDALKTPEERLSTNRKQQFLKQMNEGGAKQ